MFLFYTLIDIQTKDNCQILFFLTPSEVYIFDYTKIVEFENDITEKHKEQYLKIFEK